MQSEDMAEILRLIGDFTDKEIDEFNDRVLQLFLEQSV